LRRAAARQICDAIEERMEAGGNIVDYHGADLFPERWFDLVVVLRSDNSVLYGRLESRTARRRQYLSVSFCARVGGWKCFSDGFVVQLRRGYAQKKLTENVDAEIMQVVLDEAREAYREDIVVELRSDSIEDLESNVQRAVQWIQNWCAAQGQ
jgi:adenylate kinase